MLSTIGCPEEAEAAFHCEPLQVRVPAAMAADVTIPPRLGWSAKPRGEVDSDGREVLVYVRDEREAALVAQLETAAFDLR
ncbi:hypothetical protein AKJ09_08975 [Labilithrix luteola]|uniref:Uncharacterized protein n=1 Tax=Labilithrix luteola TaxID=1391654 RepID=A0A0K1Q9H6_9BACT|nr:hypothetical protein [Labilithrix luteola]AKV02312.1 hypothetical protein AKJ09_08975 [Labilithrix luteola]